MRTKKELWTAWKQTKKHVNKQAVGGLPPPESEHVCGWVAPCQSTSNKTNNEQKQRMKTQTRKSNEEPTVNSMSSSSSSLSEVLIISSTPGTRSSPTVTGALVVQSLVYNTLTLWKSQKCMS